MTDYKPHIDYEKLLYERAAGALKVHGIISIVFGAIGTLVALLFTLLITAETIADPSYDTYYGPFGLFILSTMVFVFWTLPHLYLIAAGIYLTREPAPKVAKTLIIINLVVGVFWNLVLVVISIVNLTQIADYKRAYHVHKKK